MQGGTGADGEPESPDRAGFDYIARAGLTGLLDLPQVQVDEPMIRACIRHWDSTRNTFVFPWGEMTITLEDIYRLYGLAPGGDVPLTTVWYPTDRDQMDRFLTGAAQSAGSTGARLSTIGATTEVPRHRRVVISLLMTYVIAGKGMHIFPYYLYSVLEAVDAGGRFDWPRSMLAHLYHDLYATRERSRAGIGACELLQAWIWERIPALAPPAVDIDPRRPRIYRWCGAGVRGLGLTEDMYFRRLRILLPGEYDWRPYMGVAWTTDSPDLMASLRVGGVLQGRIHWIRETYRPERVQRQFGLLQEDVPAPEPMRRHRHERAEAPEGRRVRPRRGDRQTGEAEAGPGAERVPAAPVAPAEGPTEEGPEDEAGYGTEEEYGRQLVVALDRDREPGDPGTVAEWRALILEGLRAIFPESQDLQQEAPATWGRHGDMAWPALWARRQLDTAAGASTSSRSAPAQAWAVEKLQMQLQHQKELREKEQEHSQELRELERQLAAERTGRLVAEARMQSMSRSATRTHSRRETARDSQSVRGASMRPPAEGHGETSTQRARDPAQGEQGQTTSPAEGPER